MCFLSGYQANCNCISHIEARASSIRRSASHNLASEPRTSGLPLLIGPSLTEVLHTALQFLPRRPEGALPRPHFSRMWPILDAWLCRCRMSAGLWMCPAAKLVGARLSHLYSM